MTIPSWYLNELAHAGAEHLDTQYVPAYDAKAATDPSGDVQKFRELGLQPAHTLIDFGAGTGTFALAVAPLCRRVVAVDVSPSMLIRLQEKAAQSGITNIECVQAGFLSYEHVGSQADFIYSRHALHHLPDFWKALAFQRMAAMLCPGGTLFLRELLFACELDEVHNVIERWLARANDSPERGWTRTELDQHLRDEYSTFTWLVEPMIERAGFRIHEAHYDQSRIYTAYVCVRESPVTR